MTDNIIQFPSEQEKQARAKAMYDDIILHELSMHSEFLDYIWTHLDNAPDLLSRHKDFKILYKGITKISIQTGKAIEKLQSQQLKHSPELKN